MNITLIQADLVWNDPAANRNRFEREIFAVGETDLVVLPEMFPTGFCTRPREAAEPDGGPTLAWMRRTARKKGAALAGSVAVEQDGRYFNRFYFVRPDGATVHYDKRHLFTYGGEHKEYTGGDRRVIAEYKGWRILLQVCYDLRFPVWSRNDRYYDLLLCVANWPESRIAAWDTLLRARAIENMAYVAGANRVGRDSLDSLHTGHSVILTPLGKPLAGEGPATEECILSASISLPRIRSLRDKYGFLEDRDRFSTEE